MFYNIGLPPDKHSSLTAKIGKRRKKKFYRIGYWVKGGIKKWVKVRGRKFQENSWLAFSPNVKLRGMQSSYFHA
jgi:hypothetical protein